MSLTITLPQIDKKSTTKDYIISLLGMDWPLSAKKIYSQIKIKYAYPATYQAVFKTLNLLMKDGVIDKTKDGYQINISWLKELHRYTERVESNYYTQNRFSLLDGIKESKQQGFINILTFSTLFDVEKYLYYLQKQYLFSAPHPETICVHHLHEWRPLFYLRAEYNYQKKLHDFKHKTYILCQGNTIIDRWAAKFYRQSFCQVKTNVNCASAHELMVFSDFVIEVYIPLDLQNKMHRALTKNLDQLDHNKLIKEIFEKETNIQVIVHQNSVLAEQLKMETMKYFKK